MQNTVSRPVKTISSRLRKTFLHVTLRCRAISTLEYVHAWTLFYSCAQRLEQDRAVFSSDSLASVSHAAELRGNGSVSPADLRERSPFTCRSRFLAGDEVGCCSLRDWRCPPPWNPMIQRRRFGQTRVLEAFVSCLLPSWFGSVSHRSSLRAHTDPPTSCASAPQIPRVSQLRIPLLAPTAMVTLDKNLPNPR